MVVPDDAIYELGAAEMREAAAKVAERKRTEGCCCHCTAAAIRALDPKTLRITRHVK